jgi:RNA polymerase sigma-70 factor, ECF subfamily
LAGSRRGLAFADVSGYNQQRLVDAAKGGDHEAFRALTQPWMRELRAHCARILGDPHDADDAVQETLIKAWRKLDSYAATGPVRAWLYTIATTTSLNLLAARGRRPVASEGRTGVEPVGPGADARLEAHESVELAFMSAVSALPPRQRAALILRDGLGWSALEIAGLLDASMAAVNSALQRARAAIAPVADADLDPLHRALLGAYVAAWDQSDIDGLAALARADATRTTLIAQLRPVGGGWVRLPEAGGELAFRPAFMSR